jgi:hypothetical protein
MKPRYRFLLDHSINTVLSAIEIYNKPDFKDREQVFSILLVNAWESLLKAKILRDNKNRLSSLYIPIGSGGPGQRYKKNRTGNYMTISLEQAVLHCCLVPVVKENLHYMVEIRDAATHLTAASPSLPHLVFSLGTAALRNYAALVRQWFSLGLSDYNFFILPLGFSYPFKAISMADLTKEPNDIAALLKSASAASVATPEDPTFFFACEIRTHMVSAKKLADADVTARIDPSATGAVVVSRDVRPIDRYPYSFQQVWERLKAALPALRQPLLQTFIREQKVKENGAYATYNYRNKQDEARGPRRHTPVIYNDDFVRFAGEALARRISDDSLA